MKLIFQKQLVTSQPNTNCINLCENIIETDPWMYVWEIQNMTP